MQIRLGCLVVGALLLAIGASRGTASTSAAGDDIVFVSNWAENFGASDIYSVDSSRGQRRRLTETPFDNEFSPTPSPDGAHVAFVHERSSDGVLEMIVAEAGGGNPRVLSRGLRAVHDPAWSPDGRSLAFLTEFPSALYIASVDGGSIQRLAESAYSGSASWSPHGDRLVFSGVAGLAVIDADGAHLRSLGLEGEQPAWSPAGSEIAFLGGCCLVNAKGVFLVDPDGALPARQIVSGEVDMPVWAPDGQHLALVRGLRDDGYVAVVRRDGADEHALTHQQSFAPMWASDGRSIAYVRTRREKAEVECVCGDPVTDEIHIIDADGTDDKRLLSEPLERIEHPRWMPDGHSLIASVRLPMNDPEIFVMSADGTRVRQLTKNLLADRDPSWSPDHRRIAFVRDVWRSDDPYDDCLFCPMPWIYVMNVDGMNVHRLVRGKHPAWSHDGRRIAFDDGYDILVISSRGGHPRRVSRNRNWRSLNPSWSPDDRRLVFERAFRLTIAPTTGGQGRYGTPAKSGDELGLDSLPSWSPKGSLIAFDRRDRICLFTVTTTRVRCLGTPPESWSPEWSPNGAEVLFDSYEKERAHRVIVISDLHRRERVLRADAPGDAIQPDW